MSGGIFGAQHTASSCTKGDDPPFDYPRQVISLNRLLSTHRLPPTHRNLVSFFYESRFYSIPPLPSPPPFPLAPCCASFPMIVALHLHQVTLLPPDCHLSAVSCKIWISWLEISPLHRQLNKILSLLILNFQKKPGFFSIFWIFRNFYLLYENFINKKHWNRGVFHSQIRCTVFNSSKKFKDFLYFYFYFFGIFGFFWEVHENFFEWTTPRPRHLDIQRTCDLMFVSLKCRRGLDRIDQAMKGGR